MNTTSPFTHPMATPDAKATFVRDLCDRVRDQVIERTAAMPADWNGIEIRLYLAQLFSDEVPSHIAPGSKLRREYQNTVAITQGL